ncbi:MAG: anaerobic ribonucleoside-triphosphate reductase activating protein [Desulfobacterota bacterium]|nr:anaerobic ribonucleoside-triphosphate reductase activating protein [Thermodesulfobacteriota bacterium]
MVDIKGFLETSFVDWPGKICSVLFLPRCNFRCPYCHNHGLILHPDRFASIPIAEVFRRLASFKGWIDGICLTGGEPTLHPDLPLLVRQIKERGWAVKLDTNGSNPKMLRTLIEEGGIDFVAMDVKAPLDPLSYGRITGRRADLEAIRESIALLKENRVEYQFRMTVVPLFHTEGEVRALAQQLRAGSRLILQNFNPADPLDPSLKRLNPYDPKTLKEMERMVHTFL